MVIGEDLGARIGHHIYSPQAALYISEGYGDYHSANIHIVKEAMYYGRTSIAMYDEPGECLQLVRLMVRKGARLSMSAP